MPKRTKRKHTRNKDGCVTCRRRKKRCDYGRPKCGNCDRLKLDCEYKKEQSVWSIRNLNPDGTTSQQLLKFDKDKPVTTPETVIPEQDEDIEEIPRESPKNFSPGSPWNINFLIDNDYSDLVLVPVEKKSPEPYEPHFRATFTNDVFLTYDSLSRDLGGYRFAIPKYVSVEAAEILLSYFCEKMAPTFSVCGKQSSSLVSTYLPLASCNIVVMSALLAWVSFHFEKNGDDQFVALKERLLSDVELKFSETASKRDDLPVEVTLAPFLIMIAIENKGTTLNWVRYLRMAQRTINESTSTTRSRDFIWLRNNVIYHEVTAPSLLMLEEPFIFDSDNMDDVPEAYMGISRRIYMIMGHIFKLSRKLVASSSLEVLEEVSKEADDLEQQIENCRTLDPTEDMILNGTLVYHEIFFQVLKDSARLYIRQCVYMVAPVSLRSTLIVGRMMNSLKRLFGTEMDPALLFPLFIMGVDTVTENVRQWVIDTLNELYNRVGSGNILIAIKLLNKVWDLNSEGKIHVLWPKVARECGLLVSLA